MKSIVRLTMIAMLSFLHGIAQNNDNIVKEFLSKDASYILTDMSYMNDAVFMGRRDSIAAPYILPSVGYYDSSGFFADASLSYLTATNEQRVDLFLLSAGYLFDAKKWSGGLSATGYFFNKESYNVQSEMTANLSGLISYDLDVLAISLALNSFFNSGSSTDVFSEIMLNRVFYADDRRLIMQPSFVVQLGTQNFYEAYYQSSRYGNRKGKGIGGQNQMSSSTLTLREATEFNLLNIGLSIPLQYHLSSFIFSFTPNLSFPQSSVTIRLDDTVIEEKLESIFYWSVGISYWFPTTTKKQF
tara:strand:+ start:12852 stop:13751 length:900 start_codon:yes stop_codon:yes gene_type:complete